MSASGTFESAMPTARQWREVHAGWPVALALALPILFFLLEGDVGLSLLDEGFLWYGAQRVLAGELPLRDFQSYDIGRYYWSAAWMGLTGSTGILPVRAGNAVLASAAVVIAVRLIRAGSRQPAWQLALAALAFSMLMLPQEKIADSFAALLLVAGLAGALRQPDDARGWAGFGVCLGLAGTIGINHGLYGVVGGALGGLYAAGVRRQAIEPRLLAALAAGAAVGYAPVLACHLLVPGFTAAFIDTIRQLFEAGTTNLALALPRVGSILDVAESAVARREALLAVLFVAAPCFLLVCARRLQRDDGDAQAARPTAAFAAAVALSVPYAHYAYSRADFVHVVVSALPLMVAAWTFPPRRWPKLNRAALTAIAVGSISFLLPKHPGFLALQEPPLERVVVQGDTLRLPPPVADELALLRRLTETQAAGKRDIYVAPYWPGAYAATGRRSPTWEIYALFPASAARQRREIERLASANIGLALINEWQMDGRPDLGFERTHPLIAAYIRRCLRQLDAVANPMPKLLAYVADAPRCAPR